MLRSCRCSPFRNAARSGRHTLRAVHCSATKTSIIRTIQQELASRQRSCVEITQEYLQRLESVDTQINSFITVIKNAALAQAKAVDASIADGSFQTLGCLAGTPIAVKDTLCTKGVRTTAGSRVLEHYTPSYDATAVARLLAAGAIIVGKTNNDEFAMGSTSENSAYGPTCNPRDLARVPGGSSGGSAAAVAADFCAGALGSDTGGSIRLPAHFCGVVGLKPTYGRVSRYGLIMYASSLDCVGPLAHTVEDVALIMNAIAGADPNDATSSLLPVPDYTTGLIPASGLSSQPLAGVKVGLIQQTMGAGVLPDILQSVQASAKHLESLGATLQEVSLPVFELGLPAYYVIATSEASSNLSRFDGVRYGLRETGDNIREMYSATRGAGLGPEVKRRILMGTYALSAGYYDAYYKKAQQGEEVVVAEHMGEDGSTARIVYRTGVALKSVDVDALSDKVRRLVQQQLDAALKKVDVLISPTAPNLAFKLGETVEDPLTMWKADVMTVNLNLSGLPGITIPCGWTKFEGSKLPIGLQMVGKAYGEADLLRIAHVFEQTHCATQ